MTETPEERVERLAAELAAAQADQRVAHLRADLAQARGSAGDPPSAWPTVDGAAGERNPGSGDRLAEPPRRVPPTLLVAALRWRWWEAWALLMVAAAPIALWMAVPWAAILAGIVALAVAILLRLRSAWTAFVLLRNGRVADRVQVVSDRTGSYFSGVTYQNVRMAVAQGWQVTRRWYSGPGTRSVLQFTVDGRPGTVTLHGLPYAGGVVLADPRRPDRARCVSEFPYDLDRDADGNWIGSVPIRIWVGSLFTLVVWAGWALLVRNLAVAP